MKKAWIVYKTESDYRENRGYNFYGTESQVEALKPYYYETEKF